MTNEPKHLQEDTLQEDSLQEDVKSTLLSKRDAVAALYARMTSGLRRRVAGTQEPAAPPTAAVGNDVTGPQPLSEANGAAQAEQEPVPPSGPRSEMEWNDLISHRIEEAMRNGAFDNLRNKGKPLPQEYNPHVPEDRRMANDLLKNNGLAPQWIADRSSVLHLIDTFRTKFRAVALRYQTAWHAETTDVVKRQQLREQWATQLETWQEEIRVLNRRIEIVNLQQPIARLEIFKLLLDEELKRVGMARELTG